MRAIKVKANQTLMDIALQEYGSVEGVYELVRLNHLRGITDSVYEGDEVKAGAALRRTVQQYLTPFPLRTGKDASAEGIGFYALETDFIIR